jgi:hypothetical protein
LKDTDLIVRGVPGSPQSYLSDDQRAVLSDYPILNATILYQKRGLESPPDPATKTMTVTLMGGVIEINGLTYTDRPSLLPGLDPGSESVLCLKRDKGKYVLALWYLGAFSIRSGELAPLARHEGFAPEVRQVPAARMISTLVSRAEVLHAQK